MPALRTPRLLLEPVNDSHLDGLYRLNSDPAVMRYITGGRPTPRDDVRNELLPAFLGYYERFAGYGFWAAIEKASGDFLGWFHFRPPDGGGPDEAELGYRLRRAAWGKGYGTEGARALIHKGVPIRGGASGQDHEGREPQEQPREERGGNGGQRLGARGQLIGAFG